MLRALEKTTKGQAKEELTANGRWHTQNCEGIRKVSGLGALVFQFYFPVLETREMAQ